MPGAEPVKGGNDVDRPNRAPMEPLELLWEAADTGAAEAPSAGAAGARSMGAAMAPSGEVRAGLPAALRAMYGGDLTIALRSDRPTVVANFVSTLDGVVAIDPSGRTGGGEISGFAEADRFVMALLRAVADAVIVGAGTVRPAPGHEWTPRGVHAASAPALEAWRGSLGLATSQPRIIVVSVSGRLDPAHRGLTRPDVPVTIVTTQAGAARLGAAPFSPDVRVRPVAGADRVEPEALLDAVRDEGARLALCEGGPHLIGGLLGAGLVDELFLTLAPQVAGRNDDLRRLGLVEGLALPAGAGRWAALRSVRRSGDLLFLRYRFRRPAQVS